MVVLQVVTLAAAGMLVVRVEELSERVRAAEADVTALGGRVSGMEVGLGRRLDEAVDRLAERLDLLEVDSGSPPSSSDTRLILRRLDEVREAVRSLEERIDQACADSPFC